jgi:hypothetical protein
MPKVSYGVRTLSLPTVVALLAVAPGIRAQTVGPIGGWAGGHLQVSNPVGEFAENVGVGFGVAGHGLLPLDDGGTLSLRLDLGFINYGNETIRICITLPCRVTGELTTSNNIFLLGLGPELSIGSGRVRVYGNASAGLAYFATSSSVEGENNEGDPFAESTNFDDATFAWTAGPGARLGVYSGEGADVFLDLFARYHGNGEAQYLRKGDIHDQPDGSVVITPQRSDTNFWTFGLGVSVAIRREVEPGP